MAERTGAPPAAAHLDPASSQVARYLAADAPPVPLHYLTHLFEHVADVIFFLEVLDGDRYRFSAVNERFTLTTGLPVAAVVGKEVDQIIPPASLDLVKSKYREAIATRKVVRWQEVSTYPTGARTGEVTVSPVIDADGGCHLLMGVVHDITEHVRNRHQLELGSLVFQNSHEAIAVLDADGRIETVNPAFTAMRGFTLEDLAGQAPQVYSAGLADADFCDALWTRLRATGQWRGELWSRHKDGHVIAEYRTMTAACGPDGQVRNYIEIGTDISDSKRAEEMAWRWRTSSACGHRRRHRNPRAAASAETGRLRLRPGLSVLESRAGTDHQPLARPPGHALDARRLCRAGVQARAADIILMLTSLPTHQWGTVTMNIHAHPLRFARTPS
jgi:PAS domain S-box-containing protein